MQGTVYIVHAVDVEGPMTETLEATFERMYNYGLPTNVEISEENLLLIQLGEMHGIDLNLAKALKRVFNRRSLRYLKNWGEIDDMLLDINTEKFRMKYCSKDGSPYLLSWFIYDHHDGFSDNPRYHEVGTHKIFDHYMELFLRENGFNDGIYWHYHHPSISGNALESNTCWTNRTNHEEIVARRMIKRGWYFSCFRAGMHIERNDMSHWLEMFFPFDFSARYSADNSAYAPGDDFDWRGCSSRWGGWHPDWYDYRKEGGMKRWLFRCCDMWTYLSTLSDEEVTEAFDQALEYGSSVLTYYDHDTRDIRRDIDDCYQTIIRVSKKYPNINWKFVNALEAAQKQLNLNPGKPKLSYELDGSLLWVKCQGEKFGPQPFLAIQEADHFFRDNFTDEGNNSWAYTFRNYNLVQAFAVAANSPSGHYDIFKITL